MSKPSAGFSAFQIFTLCIVSAGLGTMCFAPFYSSGGAGAAWPAAVLLASGLCAAAAAVYIMATRRLCPTDFGQLLTDFLPRPLARALLILSGFFFISQASLSAFAAADAAGMYLLEHTPRGAILLALLLTACFVYGSGLKYTSRCCEILLMFIAPALAVLLAVCLCNVDLKETAALVPLSFSDLLRQLPAALVSVSGAAAVVFCAGHRVKNGGSAVLGFFCAAAISALLYLCTAGIFTAGGAATQKFPFIEMTRSVSIGTISLTERFDTIFISVMLIAAILQISLLCSCACHCLSGGFSLRQECFVWLLLPVVFAVSFYAESQTFCRILMQIILRGTLVIALALIPAICIAAWLQKKEASDNA